MFFLNSDSRINKIAGSLADRLDKRPKEVVGEPITVIVASQDVNSLRDAISRVQRSEKSHTVVCQLEASNVDIPVEIELAPVAEESHLGAVVGTIDWESANGSTAGIPARLISRQNIITLLEDAAMIYEITDSDAIFRVVNSAFEQSFRYTAEQVVDSSLYDYIIPAKCQNEANQFHDQVSDGSITQKVVTRRTASGLRKFSRFELPLSRGTGNAYRLAIYTELTSEQQAQQQLRVLHRVLRHNLRNELTVIMGMIERIHDETPNNGIESTAQEVITHTERLDDISEKARIAEQIFGDSRPDTALELGETIEQVVSETRAQWPDAEILTDIETPLPVSTGFKFRDAVENLIENAIVHGSESPTVRVSARTQMPIHSTTRATGQSIIVTIEDNGPGIPENEREVIFDHQEMNDLRHGSGLGLWITRWVVEAAGGTISYSRSDGWTTITLRLPLATEVMGRAKHGSNAE